MALGRHWEWRGFGPISDPFREMWSSLEFAMPDQQWYDVVDRYLWVPGYGMNAKMRSGPPIGDCLKFKRLRARWNQMQLWHEDPDEIHRFPIRWSDLVWLAKELRIELPGRKYETVGFEEAIDVFREATPPVQVIEVKKHRQARRWQNGKARVLIEIAELSEPEQISSLCLESTLELTELSSPEQLTAARDSVRRAVDELAVVSEGLQEMNYVDALAVWSQGDRLSDRS